MGSQMWNVYSSDQADILSPVYWGYYQWPIFKYFDPSLTCYSDTERKFSQNCPWSHYYTLLAKTCLPQLSSVSRHSNTIIPNWTYSKHVKLFRCPGFIPVKWVSLDMWGSISIEEQYWGHLRSDSGSYFLNSVHLKYLPNWSNFTQLKQYLKNS